MKLIDVHDNCIFELETAESVATLLSRAKASGARNWQNAYIKHTDLSNFNFFGLDIKGIQFNGVNLYNANFAGQNLKYADFHNCDLTHANFNGANLSGTYFKSCTIINTRFSSNIKAAFFVGCSAL